MCIWWDWKGEEYELLPPGKTMNSVLYCKQLMRLKQEVQKKRPELSNRKGVVVHHDNTRPHAFLPTRQILREFDWEARSPTRQGVKRADSGERGASGADAADSRLIRRDSAPGRAPGAP
ncbi:Mariner Mos1 transposase [Eumeta japonica]|uniref:Mariner Mos1 transposase n=1 Tax=Eumeta variegata TaxID=151549 RepID=A0A4C1SAY5_EUMVA|nr:Mariner Mos1 transposase [Eumeta japonica]